MSPKSAEGRCTEAEQLPLLAAGALPPDERRATELHIATCPECRQELEALLKVTNSFCAWPTDVLRPGPGVWERLAGRIAAETGEPPPPATCDERLDPEWEEAAPGIYCKLLTTDAERGRVSMLVRLDPGVDYPPHLHAEFEELHLLDGELWINERKLYPGDFSRAEPGTADHRVWSETGCTCFLTTSFRDVLG
jgi:anti-sigma factor ChrR (cupin superfamily)